MRLALGLGATQVETIHRQSSVAAKPPAPLTTPTGAFDCDDTPCRERTDRS